MYQRVWEFSLPNVAVACGEQICSYKINEDYSMQIVDIPSGRGSIVSLAADWQQLYMHFQNNTSVVHIYAMETKQWNRVQSVKRKVYIDEDQREAYTGFKSFYFKQEREVNLLKISTFPDASSLPIPPMSCIFPKMRIFHLKMISAASIEAKMSQTWRNEDACRSVSQPAVMFQIRYAVILDKNNVADIRTPSAYSCRNLSCLEVKSKPTRDTSIVMEFSGFISDKVYYFEAAVIPALEESIMLKWYTGWEYDHMEKVFKTHYEEDKAATIGIVLSITFTLVIVCLISILLWMYNRTWYLYKSLKRLTTGDIKREQQLGHGHYGEVWRATLFGKDVIVVKTLKESATNLEEKQFREEALLLSKLNSEFIIKSLGICLQSKPMMLALEYMNGGSVDSYLCRDDVRNVIDGGDLFLIIQDTAKACIYLSSGGYVHRDLAARNVLVSLVSKKSPKPKIAKLTDFGLAKDIGQCEIYKSSTPETNVLPTAWTAPEAFDGQFSPSSDVWSFGVFIWEVFSWGSTPFGKCSLKSSDHICPLFVTTNMKIQEMIRLEGKTLMDTPQPCTADFSEDLRQILQWCFSSDPDERPSFTQLLKFIQKRKARLCETQWNVNHHFIRMHSNEMQLATTNVEPENPLSPAYAAMNVNVKHRVPTAVLSGACPFSASTETATPMSRAYSYVNEKKPKQEIPNTNSEEKFQPENLSTPISPAYAAVSGKILNKQDDSEVDQKTIVYGDRKVRKASEQVAVELNPLQLSQLLPNQIKPNSFGSESIGMFESINL